MRKSRTLSWVVLVMFMMTIFLCADSRAGFAATSLKDIQGNWAQSQIQSMVDQGIIAGYPDGSFKPDNNVTRAEFISMVNGTFSLEDSAAINFTDVKPGDWFAPAVAVAKKAGYISGYPDGSLKPTQNITRQEMAAIMVNVLKLDTKAGSDGLGKFTDAASIPAWSSNAIAAMVRTGYMAGYPDGTFKALDLSTRAMAAFILSKVPARVQLPAQQTVFDKAGTYGSATGTDIINNNVTISADGVNLQNTTINGNLLITEAVGAGTVILKNLRVSGTTTINGGGENSIKIDNCKLGIVMVDKKDGKIRLVLSGSSTIAEIIANSAVNVVGQAKIEKATINKSGVIIEAKPTNTVLANGITAIVGGQSLTGPSVGGGGGGRGGSSATYYSEAGTFGPDSGSQTINGDVIISATGVTLRNTVVTGDLEIAKSVGSNGNVTLKNVTVQGNTYINGGGANSIHTIDCGFATVIVNDENNTVRIVASGTTTTGNIELRSGATLQEENLTGTGTGFSNISLAVSIPANATVIMEGNFGTVSSQAVGVKIQVPSGSINSLSLEAPAAVTVSGGTVAKLDVGAGAANTTVSLGSGGSVTALTTNASTAVTGTGSIGTATINSNGTTIAQTPAVTNVAPAVTTPITVGNYTVQPGTSVTYDGTVTTYTGDGGSSTAVSISSISANIDGGGSNYNSTTKTVTLTGNANNKLTSITVTATPANATFKFTRLQAPDKGISIPLNTTQSCQSLVTIASLLGDLDNGGDGVSLSSLNRALGGSIILTGDLSAPGYSSVIGMSITVVLPSVGGAELFVTNEWVKVSRNGNTVTATIINNDSLSVIAERGIGLIWGGGLPSVSTASSPYNWRDANTTAGQTSIRSDVATLIGGKAWSTAVLNDLKGKTVYFKDSSNVIYTLTFNS